MNRLIIFLVLCALVRPGITLAQDSTPVPDLTGMNVPQAAAVLNHAGLALGHEAGELWSAESGFEQNRIKGQSIAAGQPAAPGTPIDITVLRSPNVALVYDDNDLTLINKTGADLDLSGILFNTLDGTPAQFAAARWAGAVRTGQCMQLWSVGRNGPKGVDECGTIQNWIITTNGAEHFWTGGGGTTQFVVSQNGIQRAVCPIANPGRCEFYLPGGTAGDVTEYIYFAYTSHNLAVINQSTDRWMTLSGFTVYNNFTPQKGLPIRLDDSSLYAIQMPAARINQLAPGQCLLFTDSTPDATTPPQTCDVIASLNISPQLIFWGAAFDMQGTASQRHSCPAATDGSLTYCVMPR